MEDIYVAKLNEAIQEVARQVAGWDGKDQTFSADLMLKDMPASLDFRDQFIKKLSRAVNENHPGIFNAESSSTSQAPGLEYSDIRYSFIVRRFN
ncbi:hypothetical protein [Pseudomonas sp. MWU318]|uniref:hypothetical protein n=1 Tax=Pseudomonas sp. MWU318 TaxID=2802569 RepID=UPI0019274304|nr:hypothetical protein [Pseudomonas sp. MWU318]